MQNTLSFIISGTGTNVGKTYVTSCLLRSLLASKCKAQAVKIVQTGVTDTNDPEADAYQYAQAVEDLSLSAAACLTAFPLPASPHLAARKAGTHLSVQALRERITNYQLASECDVLLFETAGGLRVPLNEGEDMLDLLRSLDLPVILVAENTLGAINHALLSVDCLQASGLSLYAFVTTERNGNPTPLEETIQNDTKRYLADHLANHYFDPEKQEKTIIVALPHAAVSDNAPLLSPLVDRIQSDYTAALHTACSHDSSHDNSQAQNKVVARDDATLWHPYSRNIRTDPLYAVRDTYQNYIELTDGRCLIDGMSSWWAAIHGYKHPHIVRALHAQAERFPHVMFGGFTHEPAVRLGERLAKLLHPCSRVFFSDSGSVAVEVALKMAIQYQYGHKHPEKSHFVTALGGYYGDTFGAMSVCDPYTGMHHLFTDTVAKQFFLPKPAARFDAPFDAKTLDPAKQLFSQHGHEIAALIIEPIAQGAGGMWFYHPAYLRGLVELAREQNCLVIFDEIATGFGHTGKFFAKEWAHLEPDIICVGKALTGGTITLAATVCTESVAEGICQNNQVFMHGPTFMANPLACAVANASLDLLEDNTWQKNVSAIETLLKEGLAPCRALPTVRDVRVLGDIGVVQTKKKVDTASLSQFFTSHGVWIRPFADLVYLMPPYITPEQDIRKLCATIFSALEHEAHKTDR